MIGAELPLGFFIKLGIKLEGTWDGTRWLERKPTVSPPARNNHAMTFDLFRGRTVMFSGNAPGRPSIRRCRTVNNYGDSPSSRRKAVA